MKTLSRRQRFALVVGTAGAILAIGGALVVSARRQAAAESWIEHTDAVLRSAERAVAGLVGAEAGQRGFLLTGRETYLEPYWIGLSAYEGAAQQLRQLAVGNPGQQRRLASLEALVARKLEDLARTIDLRRTRGEAAAVDVLRTGRGQALMDSVRRVAAEIERTELVILGEQRASEARRQRLVFLVAGLGTLAAVLLTVTQGGMLTRALGAQEALTTELTDRARVLEDTADELEASNEELQATTDELQSTAEELQATNEELAATNDELARGEARFRTLAEHLPAPLVVCGSAGETTYVNPAWTALTGVSAAHALAEGWRATVHPDEQKRVAEACHAAHAGERAEVQYRHVRPDGTVRHVRTIFEAVRSLGGEASAILGMGLDLTEQFEQEEQLRHAQRMQAVGRLAGGMAHELNNMLTAGIGFGVYALRSLPAEHAAARDIAESLKAQERAARITSHVLSFSRRQMLAPTLFDLSEALADLAPLLKQSLEAAQKLRLELADGAGTVHADRTRLDQAILNLALNARDAMPAAGTLTLRVRHTSLAPEALIGPEGERLRAGEYLVLVVSDSGAGMDAETRRRALEPFFTTKPVGQGTGLGLSMAYGFVRQTGGRRPFPGSVATPR